MSNKNNRTNLIEIMQQCIQIIKYNFYNRNRINWLPLAAEHQGIDSNARLKQVVHSKVRMIKNRFDINIKDISIIR